MSSEWMTSVGLDVGTSTTKFVVSRLRVAVKGNPFTLADYEIMERILAYESPVHLTPMLDEQSIDTSALELLLARELREAGIKRSDVKTGAVIITGETAAKVNAEQLVHLLSDQAGDFVAAVAGPDLEGILAGRGSGAERRSLASWRTVANIDVGGGTANIALFRRGDAIAMVTFHIGGRLIRMDGKGVIQHISPSIQHWLRQKGFELIVGERVEITTLKEAARALARAMFDYLTGHSGWEAQALCVGPLPANMPRFEEIMLSGGVAELLKKPPPLTIAEAATYGDVGPLLAHALAEEIQRYKWTVVEAEQLVRATVVGAGRQSMELSGSTIHADEGALPVRNVPVLQAVLQMDMDWGNEMNAIFQTCLRLFDLHTRVPFALAIDTPTLLSYAQLRILATILADQFQNALAPEQAAVVILSQDMAKALGQLLSLRCCGKPAIICIDRIRLRHGDYIDIGNVIAGSAVPVVVKTLLFPTTGPR